MIKRKRKWTPAQRRAASARFRDRQCCNCGKLCAKGVYCSNCGSESNSSLAIKIALVRRSI